MRTWMGPTVVLVVTMLGGCAPGSGTESDEATAADESSDAAGPAGTVTLAFGVTNGVRMGPTLVDPLVGPVHGGIFLTADVTLTGPREGVAPVISMEVDEVDLVTADVAASTWTSEPLPAGRYTFLGMLDVDGNFDETGGFPDAGDPITLTGQSFDVVAGQETTFMAVFELVYG